jgi:hypothetical protein
MMSCTVRANARAEPGCALMTPSRAISSRGSTSPVAFQREPRARTHERLPELLDSERNGRQAQGDGNLATKAAGRDEDEAADARRAFE